MRTKLAYCLGVMLLIGGAAASWGGIPYTVKRISDRVLIITDTVPWENTITAIATEKGLIIIDTHSSRTFARQARQLIAKELQRDDFAMVINTHHHFDHTSGNQEFNDCIIVGHDRCGPDMTRFARNLEPFIASRRDLIQRLSRELAGMDDDSPEAAGQRALIEAQQRLCDELSQGYIPTLPDLSFDDRLTLRLGDITVECIYSGRGTHVSSDIIIRIPEEHLLVTGDIFAGTWIQFSDGPDADLPRFLSVLDDLIDAEPAFQRVITTHNGIMNRSDIVQRRDYWKTLWHGIREAKSGGKSYSDVCADFSSSRIHPPEGPGIEETEREKQHRRTIDLIWRSLQRSGAGEIERLLEKGAAADAEAAFARMLEDRQGEFYLDEAEFNRLGYACLRAEQLEKAAAVLKMNTEAFPESWNVWDSLAEAYSWAGRYTEAKESFLRSLQLNPENRNAVNQLSRVEGYILDEIRETKTASIFQPGQNTGIRGPYLGQTPPGLTPRIFAEGIISRPGGHEFGITFSPDGSCCYFSTRTGIQLCRLEESGWTAPAPVPWKSEQFDHEPHITPDGQHLFFGSSRPLADGSDNYGIWVMDTAGDGWSAPRYHGPGMYVTTTAAGDMYVTDIERVAGGGIIMYPMQEGIYGEPVRCGGGVNHPAEGVHPCIAPDGRFIIFDSSRPGGQGGEGDLYVCFRQPDGSWGEAVNLGDTINTPGTNFCATLSPDGQYLFYNTNRDIYWVSTKILDSLRKN